MIKCPRVVSLEQHWRPRYTAHKRLDALIVVVKEPSSFMKSSQFLAAIDEAGPVTTVNHRDWCSMQCVAETLLPE
jgi:hypothetical protein